MTSFCGLTFVLFCFVFVFIFFSLESRLFVQPSFDLRYAGASIATRVFFFFPFVCLDMSPFPSMFCTIAGFSLNGEYVVRSFLPNGVFLPCDHGLDF